MPIDFRASNIQTQKIIASGSIASSGRSQIAIYPIESQDTGSPNQGQITSPLLEKIQSSDVFLFVSGAVGSKDSSNAGVAVFGGDLHISGNLTIDGSGGGGGGGGGIPTLISNSLGDVSVQTDVVGDGSDKSILATIDGAQVMGMTKTAFSASTITTSGLRSSLALGSGAVAGFFDGTFFEHSDPSDSKEAMALYTFISNPGSATSKIQTALAVGDFATTNTSFSAERRKDLGPELFRSFMQTTVSSSTSKIQLQWQSNQTVASIEADQFTITVPTSSFSGEVVLTGSVNLRGGYCMTPTIYASNTLVPPTVYLAMVSASSPITLELSASCDGQTHIIKDLAGNCSTHNITVSSSMGYIDGGPTFTFVNNFSSYTFVYVENNNVWSVL